MKLLRSNRWVLPLAMTLLFINFSFSTDVSHFTIPELCHSSVADSLNIPNRPDEEQTANLHALIDEVLDPLRNAYGKPIRVNSGFRSPDLNRAVGGVRNSDHLRGCAADITVGTATGNRTLFELAPLLHLPYDQLIDEQNATWIHISHRRERNRRERLKQ